MKKVLLAATVIFTTVSAGYTCYDKVSQGRELAEMSELEIANVKALANYEKSCYLTVDWKCQDALLGIACTCGLDYGDD